MLRKKKFTEHKERKIILYDWSTQREITKNNKKKKTKITHKKDIYGK